MTFDSDCGDSSTLSYDEWFVPRPPRDFKAEHDEEMDDLLGVC